MPLQFTLANQSPVTYFSQSQTHTQSRSTIGQVCYIIACLTLQYLYLCTQLTKAYTAETSCISCYWFCYVFAHNQFARYRQHCDTPLWHHHTLRSLHQLFSTWLLFHIKVWLLATHICTYWQTQMNQSKRTNNHINLQCTCVHTHTHTHTHTHMHTYTIPSIQAWT